MGMPARGLILLAVLLLGVSAAAAEVVDRIVAVVDREIILQSELDSQVRLYAMQENITFNSESELDELRRRLLDRMVEDKLVLVKAASDTSLKVSDDEIKSSLENYMNRIKSQFSTEEEFRRQLAAEGLTEVTLRRRYKDEVRKQLLKEKLMNKKLATVNVTKREVQEFYETYRDSLPERPAGVKLAHILLRPAVGDQVEEQVRARASEVLRMAKEGADFAQLARQYSEDPSAGSGGDLGFFSRGDMVKEFEEAAFDLAPGEISDLVKTEFGYHIIKLEQAIGERVRARHILFILRPDSSDVARTRALADSIYNELLRGASFDSLALKYSVDEGSKYNGGELGWYAAADLTPEFKEAIDSLEVGEVSAPVSSSSGIHIIKLLDRQPARRLSLEDDWDEIRELAKRKKADDAIKKWLDEARKQYYVDVRL